MDLMRARVALRERPLLDTFDLAIRFCAAHAWAYTKLSLVVLVPAFAVSWGAARLGGWWLGWSVTVVVTAFAGSPFTALASRLVFADKVTEMIFLKSPLGSEMEVKATAPSDPLLGEGIGAGLRKEDTALKARIDAAIAAIRQDGSYDALAKRYFDFDIYAG